ncbi:hypothetical protein QQS21_010831 [Conoideocrella luteorostrata]|uniref:CBF1-interacting co-repressor CIR N-terminal domain-containing protein n=1 Tax=Conoideocrella luteorostrata TaxID=1105319 RepID=A0AAJ0CE91_9HYPO|nr:hypothetical protein QQS21_010831 [Conoideocrella luteorostrata]
MPLHLLGKKSWNVYNADNISRVRRDEAAAKAAEEAEEQHMQEIDAQRRLAILRGEGPPPLIEQDKDSEAVRSEKRSQETRHSYGRTQKKRKRSGEDDTDFELRLAKESAEAANKSVKVSQKSSSSAPIVDNRGHIDLFGDEKTRAHAEKNKEAEREAQKKRREYEDQYTMRLSNAAGKDGIKRPWYSQADEERQDAPLKDTWGNDDPMRRQRDTNRITANDPLALMKKGASRVREIKQERKKVQEERDEELGQMRKEDKRRERHKRREGREARHRGLSPVADQKQRRSRSRPDEKYVEGHDRDQERRRHRHRDRSHQHRDRSQERESRRHRINE